MRVFVQTKAEKTETWRTDHENVKTTVQPEAGFSPPVQGDLS